MVRVFDGGTLRVRSSPGALENSLHNSSVLGESRPQSLRRLEMQYVTITPSTARYYKAPIRPSQPKTGRASPSKNNYRDRAVVHINRAYGQCYTFDREAKG
jgi:hypothetical protein